MTNAIVTDEWDAQHRIGRDELARARVRIAALEAYERKIAALPAPSADSGLPPIVTEESLNRLRALEEELLDARVAHDLALLRLNALDHLRAERGEG